MTGLVVGDREIVCEGCGRPLVTAVSCAERGMTFRCVFLALEREVEIHRARRSGLCSTHQRGEDPECSVCYPGIEIE